MNIGAGSSPAPNPPSKFPSHPYAKCGLSQASGPPGMGLLRGKGKALRDLGKVKPLERGCWARGWSLPEVIHLVEHIDVVLDLLPAQEAVHVGHEDQELLEAFAERHQHGEAVGTP